MGYNFLTVFFAINSFLYDKSYLDLQPSYLF